MCYPIICIIYFAPSFSFERLIFNAYILDQAFFLRDLSSMMICVCVCVCVLNPKLHKKCDIFSFSIYPFALRFISKFANPKHQLVILHAGTPNLTRGKQQSKAKQSQIKMLEYKSIIHSLFPFLFLFLFFFSGNKLGRTYVVMEMILWSKIYGRFLAFLG